MPTALVNDITISYTLLDPSSNASDSTTTTTTTSSSTPLTPPTIVLINGLADDQSTWLLQVPALLTAGFRILQYDNRGIGASSAPPGPYSATLLAADLKALISHIGQFDCFHLLGVSMGGMVAQQYAIDYPADLLSLTLANTYAAPGPFCGRMFALWAEMAAVMGIPTVMRDVILWAFTPSFFTTRPVDLAELETAMTSLSMSLPAYLSQLAVIQSFNSTPHLHRIAASKVPTLVLTGEQDILIPVPLSRELYDGLVELGARVEWRTVKGGHAALWEFPAEFNAAVVGFLGRVREGE